MGYFDTMPYNTYLSFSYNIGLYEWYRKDLSTGWTSHLRWNVKYTCWNHRQPWSSLEYIPIEIHAGKVLTKYISLVTMRLWNVLCFQNISCVLYLSYLCQINIVLYPSMFCWEQAGKVNFFWHLPELGTPMRVIFIAYLAWLLKGITVQYFLSVLWLKYGEQCVCLCMCVLKYCPIDPIDWLHYPLGLY